MSPFKKKEKESREKGSSRGFQIEQTGGKQEIKVTDNPGNPVQIWESILSEIQSFYHPLAEGNSEDIPMGDTEDGR